MGTRCALCCNQKQIEISKNESPADYGSNENVVFERNGKYYINNPCYRTRNLSIAILITSIQFILLLFIYILKNKV